MKATAISRALSWVGATLLGLIFVAQAHARIDPNSVVGMWLFDEESDEIVKDFSGNGNDGTINGDPEWIEGKIGKALLFDGDGDFVKISEAQGIPTTGPFLVVGWINYDIDDPAGRHPEVVTIGGAPFCPVGGIHAILLADKNALRLWRGCGAQPQFSARVVNPGVGDKEWHHIATGYDGTASLVYIDGKLEHSVKEADYERVTDFVYIGGRPQEDNVNSPYTGAVDEVAIFAAALTEADVNRIMTRGLAHILLAVSVSGKLATAWGGLKAS